MAHWPDGRRGDRAALGLAALMLVAGVAHFVVTDRYAAIVPAGLGDARAWVRISGAAEILAAGLLVSPRTRRAGGWFVAALLVAVFPANLKMAFDGGVSGETGLLLSGLAAWLRLPLQIPLVVWAVRVATFAAARRDSEHELAAGTG